MSQQLCYRRVYAVYPIHTTTMFAIPVAKRKLPEQRAHKIPPLPAPPLHLHSRNSPFALLPDDPPLPSALSSISICLHVAPPSCRCHSCLMEKLSMELAAEVASHVAKAAADPMEDLGSLWKTCS